MTQEKKENLRNGALSWLKYNGGWFLTLVTLSYQISTKVGGAAYGRISNFVDSANVTRTNVHQLQRDFSEFKVDQHIIDTEQNRRIDRAERLLTKNGN